MKPVLGYEVQVTDFDNSSNGLSYATPVINEIKTTKNGNHQGKGNEAICLYVENEVHKVHMCNLQWYNFQWGTGYKVALCRKRRGHQLEILYGKYGRNTPDIDDTPNTLRNTPSPGRGSLGEWHIVTSQIVPSLCQCEISDSTDITQCRQGRSSRLARLCRLETNEQNSSM